MAHVGTKERPNITRWILVGTLILCFVSLIGCTPTTDIPKPPSQAETPPPIHENETSPSENQEEPENQPEKRLLDDGGMGLFLCKISDGTQHGTSLVYGVGYMFTPSKSQEYAYFEFPICVTKEENGEGNQIIAEIPDPELQEIGTEWEITVRDPDHRNYLIKVKLTRVENDYKYNVESSISGDGGETWTKGLPWPYETKEEYEKRLEEARKRAQQQTASQ